MRAVFLCGLLFASLAFNSAGRVHPEAVEFAGLIEKGPTYRAEIVYDKEQGWRTVVKLRVPYHHGARIDWINLVEYPALDKPGVDPNRQRILFEMESRHVVKAPSQDRWNTTYRCRITAVEQ